MNERSKPTDDVDHVWSSLASAARRASEEATPSPGDLADRVLHLRSRVSLVVRQASERRIVTYGAALALAASLAFMVSSWGAVEDVVAPRPAVFDELVAWETLP